MAIVIDGNNTPTAGGVGYGDGTELAFTAAGTSGRPIVSGGAGAPTFRPYTLPAADGSANQILKTDGAGALSFATPTSGLTFLSTVTISNSATADVETTFNSTYDTYMIIGKINTTTGTNPILQCRLKIGGSYVTADYDYHTDISNAGSASYSGSAATAASQINMTPGLGADASYSVDFVMYVQNPTSTTELKSVFWTGRCRSISNNVKSFGQGAYTAATTALTGVRFFTSSDNLVSGTIRLYGIAKS